MNTEADAVAEAIANYWLKYGFDPSEPSLGAARAAIEALRNWDVANRPANLVGEPSYNPLI